MDMSDKLNTGRCFLGRFCALPVLFLFMGTAIHGQDRLLRKGDELYGRHYYRDAIDSYLDAVDKQVVGPDTYLKLADSYYYIGDYPEAAKWYGRLYADDSLGYGETDFRYGQSLKTIGLHELADKYLRRFYESRGQAFTSLQYLPDEGVEANVSYSVEKCLPCNTRYSEFPAFMDETDFYISGPNGSRLSLNGWNGHPTYNLFKMVDGQREELQGINSKNNELSFVMTKDGGTVYFTANERSYLDRGIDAMPRLQLYVAERESGGKHWTNIRKLPIDQGTGSFMQPTLSGDDSTLYFVSDRQDLGGKGGKDIYKVEILGDGSFGAMENLSGLNTIGDEMYPFISGDGSLYFSSNGHPSLGGLDVHRAEMKQDGTYGNPVNLGSQINSNMDDFAFVANGKGEGYFASNRLDPLDDEIYGFRAAPIERRSLPGEQHETMSISGTVVDAYDGQPLAGAELTVVDKDGNVLLGTVTDKNGKYGIGDLAILDSASIQVKKDNYEPMSINLPKGVKDLDGFNVVLKGQLGDRFDVLVHFGFDSKELDEQGARDLDLLSEAMKKFPAIRIKLSGHTDSVGDNGYNLTLSRQRVDSVKDYLMGTGIEEHRIDTEAFGETRQLYPSCGSCAKNRAVKSQIARAEVKLTLKKD